MWVINPAVGCHYFPPGLQLRSQSVRGLLPVLLLGEQRHDGYEEFAKDCYPTASRLRLEPGPYCAWVQHAIHSATEPPLVCYYSWWIKITSFRCHGNCLPPSVFLHRQWLLCVVVYVRLRSVPASTGRRRCERVSRFRSSSCSLSPSLSRYGTPLGVAICHVYWRYNPEMDIAWMVPWVGLGRIFQHMWLVGLCWMRSTVIFSLHFVFFL